MNIDRNISQGQSSNHDIVCGMDVKTGSPYQSTYKNKDYLFCSTGCMKKFQDDPEYYLRKRNGEKKVQEINGTIYTCPMHPEIRNSGPGSCPICGMALEPQTVNLEHEENPELRDMQLRFRFSLILTLPLLIIARHNSRTDRYQIDQA